MFNKEKTEYSPQNNSHDKLYVGIFLGVIIGAGLYWLLKTESGKKVRKVLLESNEDWAKKAREILTEAEVNDLLDEEETYPQVKTVKDPTQKAFISTITLPKRRFFKIKR